MPTLPSDLMAIPLDANIVPVSQPGLTWYIDRRSMRIVGTCDNYEAVRQAVDIILNTDRYRWGIYLPSSGVDYSGLLGQNVGYVSVELKRRILDALLMDDRVTGLSDYRYTFKGDELTVSFTVNTIFGNIPESLVVQI